MAISLTAGMRANLTNLQATAKLMEQTAVRLNTGKKVNSALDDPTSYFTAKNHMSRVADLNTLKNGMSEGIQTITAANSGIDAIVDLLAAAKSKAESAKSAEASGANDSQTLTLSGVTTGEIITIGGTTFTATDSMSDISGTAFYVGGTDSVAAASLMTAINSTVETNDNVAADGISGSTLSLSIGSTDMTADTIQASGAAATHITETIIKSDEIITLQSQYDELMDQIDALRNDSGYKGTNLLKSSDTLTVKFEGTNTLTQAGFDADFASLSLLKAGTGDRWDASATNITNDITALETATKTLESKASTLASSLSIVTTRQNFTENMINTLTTGADNLTLADMNEEGANMLMLQTQQALGTNSLSLSAQTAQGVLRLF